MTNTTRRRSRADDYVRMTMPLHGTVTHVEARLDLDAALGIDYARHWIKRTGAPLPTRSAIIRRALAVYLRHLGSESICHDAEATAVHGCSVHHGPDKDAQEAASQRLQAAIQADRLPPWREVISDPQTLRMLDGLDAKVEALLGTLRPRRTASAKSGKACEAEAQR